MVFMAIHSTLDVFRIKRWRNSKPAGVPYAIDHTCRTWCIQHTCTGRNGQRLKICRNDRSMLKAVIMKIRYNVTNWWFDLKCAPQDLLLTFWSEFCRLNSARFGIWIVSSIRLVLVIRFVSHIPSVWIKIWMEQMKRMSWVKSEKANKRKQWEASIWVAADTMETVYFILNFGK